MGDDFAGNCVGICQRPRIAASHQFVDIFRGVCLHFNRFEFVEDWGVEILNPFERTNNIPLNPP